MNLALLETPIVAPLMQRARGHGRITTKIRDGMTCLDRLYQDGCAKIRLPHTHNNAVEAVLINTAGGLTGGDRIEWQAHAPENGHLVLTTQACERIYRSTGDHARVSTKLVGAANSHIDWLPQETILFAGSKLARTIDVDLAEGASLLAVEAILLGRDAMGEEARDALLRDHWRIRRAGRLVHAEATAITGDAGRERDGLALLDGARALATVLLVAPNAQDRLEQVRALLPEEARMGVSAMQGRLVVRALANSGLALRRLIVPILSTLCASGSLPRLWHI